MPIIHEIIEWFEARGNAVVRNNVDLNQTIIGPRAIDEAGPEHISFVGTKLSDQYPMILQKSACRIILVEEVLFNANKKLELPQNLAIILSENPKSDTITFCKHFLGFEQANSNSFVHPSALVADSVKIGENTSIAANVILEENVVIGNGCSIGPNSIIHRDTIIGNDARIGACNVIGGIGFGYSKINSDEYEQFPHYGRVIMGDRVHIGNNCCVDRGSLSDTVLGDAVKIDNLVHIAHNVKIGKNTLVIANSMIAGSAVIGENCWLAPSANIRNGITIGNNVTVGMASMVTKDVADNEIVAGSPAMNLKDFNALRKIQKESLGKKG